MNKKNAPSKPLTELMNIGKTTMEKLEKINIKTIDEFLARDPYEVFDELLKKVDPTLCKCALAGIVGAKLGIPWHKITKKSADEFEKRHPDFKWREY